jgi:hypothetical protein
LCPGNAPDLADVSGKLVTALTAFHGIEVLPGLLLHPVKEMENMKSLRR